MAEVAVYGTEQALYGAELAQYGGRQMALKGNVAVDKADLGPTSQPGRFTDINPNGNTLSWSDAYAFSIGAGETINSAFFYLARESSGTSDPVCRAIIYGNNAGVPTGIQLSGNEMFSNRQVVGNVYDTASDAAKLASLVLYQFDFAAGLTPPVGDYFVALGFDSDNTIPAVVDSATVRMGTTSDTDETHPFNTTTNVADPITGSTTGNPYAGWVSTTEAGGGGGTTPTPPLSSNTSFKIAADAARTEVQQISGSPATGANEVSIWMAATVDMKKIQSNRGTLRSIMNYIKAEWSSIAATGGVMVFHCEPGGTYGDVNVNGTPTSDEVRIEVGDTVYTSMNSNHLLGSIETLLDTYIDASAGT